MHVNTKSIGVQVMTSLLSSVKRENLNFVDSKLYDFLNENSNQILTVWFEFLVYLLNLNSSTSAYSNFVKRLETEKDKILRLIGIKTYVEPFYYCESLGIKKSPDVLNFFNISDFFDKSGDFNL